MMRERYIFPSFQSFSVQSTSADAMPELAQQQSNRLTLVDLDVDNSPTTIFTFHTAHFLFRE
jgi:hypothetical protein